MKKIQKLWIWLRKDFWVEKFNFNLEYLLVGAFSDAEHAMFVSKQ